MCPQILYFLTVRFGRAYLKLQMYVKRTIRIGKLRYQHAEISCRALLENLIS